MNKRNLIQQRKESGIHDEVASNVFTVEQKRAEWVKIGEDKKAWSKIHSHVVVLGGNFGAKELHEVACPKRTSFSHLKQLHR